MTLKCCLATLLYIMMSPGIAYAESANLNSEKLKAIDSIVLDEISAGRIPGAVVLVGRGDQVAYFKAFGNRSKVPAIEPMTTNTVFDMASLTKPVATATAIMILVEQGKIKLSDPIRKFLPEWDNHGKGSITIDQLLRHRSGLIPDNQIKDYANGPEKAWENMANLDLVGPPGELFRYSDVGFMALGRIVEKVSQQSLSDFTKQRIFDPLGMTDSGYAPSGKPLPEMQSSRTAPTAVVDGKMARGQVHDPRSRALNGIAGHAGLFSSAKDISTYAQMLLNGGTGPDGISILSPSTVRLMIDAADSPDGERRALGWDVRTGYSHPRGALMGPLSFGHTGFTGTSLWIDPETGLYVVILTSRLHPDGKGDSSSIRYRVATAAASAITDTSIIRTASDQSHKISQNTKKPRIETGRTLTGIDVLKASDFALLKGKKIGLVTNHTGLDRDGNATIDLLHKANGLRLLALFSPEHGIRGAVDKEVGDSKDEKTGLPIYSLYGKNRKPTPDQLKNIDVLVYDIQDIGVRFYTYLSTLSLVMEAAGENNKTLYVLDRPNPIRGDRFGGVMRDKQTRTFVADHNIPVISGMTIAEYAQMLKLERQMPVKMEIIKCQNYDRRMFWDETGLIWTNPSPNMRSLTEAILYPGVGLLEATNIATGRGTDTPFERVGAPWINSRDWAKALNALKLSGVTFIPTAFSPTERQFAKEICNGVYIQITDREKINSIDIGLAMMSTLRKLYPNDWKPEKLMVICVNKSLFEAVEKGASFPQLQAISKLGISEYSERRAKALIYPE